MEINGTCINKHGRTERAIGMGETSAAARPVTDPLSCPNAVCLFFLSSVFCCFRVNPSVNSNSDYMWLWLVGWLASLQTPHPPTHARTPHAGGMPPFPMSVLCSCALYISSLPLLSPLPGAMRCAPCLSWAAQVSHTRRLSHHHHVMSCQLNLGHANMQKKHQHLSSLCSPQPPLVNLGISISPPSSLSSLARLPSGPPTNREPTPPQ